MLFSRAMTQKPRQKTDSGGRAKGPAAGLDARRRAVAVLSAVLDRGQTLDRALAAANASDLASRDRAFLRLLVATTLRRLGAIDQMLDGFLERPLPKPAKRVRHILRLAAAQLLFLDTAEHAAVDTAVRLAAGDSHPSVRRLKPLVNAICRRMARERAQLIEIANGDLTSCIAEWLRESWLADYGKDNLEKLARAHLATPPLDLTPKIPTDAEALARRLRAVCAHLEILPNGSLRLFGAGPIEDLPGFEEGAWWVQDVAASLAVPLFSAVFGGGNATAPLAGRAIADLCAAPGGKALQLAAAGARVSAVDVSNARNDKIRQNARRCGLDICVMTADARAWKPDTALDAILLDAPCSATGTLRRHPEVPYLRTSEDLEKLCQLQDDLLEHAFGLLKPGGCLIYAVCSLDRREGQDRIEALLGRTPKARRLPVGPEELPFLPEAVTPEGDVQTLPFFWAERGGMDGFFMARLQKHDA